MLEDLQELASDFPAHELWFSIYPEILKIRKTQDGGKLVSY